MDEEKGHADPAAHRPHSRHGASLQGVFDPHHAWRHQARSWLFPRGHRRYNSSASTDDGGDDNNNNNNINYGRRAGDGTVAATAGGADSLDAASSILNGQLDLDPSSSSALAPMSEIPVGSNDHLSTLPFVSTGCITAQEGVELFNLFMRRCAFQTVMLDPSYHTVDHVSQSSPFLWACIVYLAATYATARPMLRDELQPEMDWFVGWAVTSGEKKVEVVQGFLLLYFWNRPAADPTMDRAWLYAGIGIRMATELGTGGQGISDAERLNRERTWLMTFLVDRSLSMGAGRPWTIRSDTTLIRDSDSWCQQPQCQIWDLGISALADLLKLTSRQVDVLSSSSKTWASSALGGVSNSSSVDFDCETMMRIYNDELENYRRTWEQRGFFSSPQQSTSPDDDIHLFTMHYVTKQATLRYNYAVLVLNSYGLQYCALNPSKSPPVQSICLPGAISASKNILKAAIDGLGQWLAYAPHTILSLVGYGAVLLVKLARFTSDAVLRQRLLTDVEEAVDFLDKVALGPKHKPARLASMIRAVLSSKTPNEDRAAYPPGMEVRGWPVQSSRAASPSLQHSVQQHSMPSQEQHHHRPSSSTSVAAKTNGGGGMSAPFAATGTGMECSPLTEESDSLASLGLAFGDSAGGCAAAWTLPFSPNELFDESFWIKVPEN
ncbi:hypothetical protein L7F22_014634 [Adiantum nelumboides]|nr:hypothetical protein [Adiantum nelumboides]